MANNLTPLEQLKVFLNEIFQFESQDLDFGVYKILHYKRKELNNCTYDLFYINDQAHIDGYQLIEEVFKNKMLN